MTAIVSPQPRRASRKAPPAPAILALSPPLCISTTDLPPRNASAAVDIASPPRLLSPIHLGDPPSYLSKPASPCGSKRRRGHAGASARAARRRHSHRNDCAINYAGGPAMFDRLSWISQLQDVPQRADICDIADLSLLPIEQLPHETSSGVGPVRSRKSSLRSDPMASAPAPNSQDRVNRRTHPILLLDREVIDPHTPPPYENFDPEGIQFHSLLPALPVYECRR